MLKKIDNKQVFGLILTGLTILGLCLCPYDRTTLAQGSAAGVRSSASDSSSGPCPPGWNYNFSDICFAYAECMDYKNRRNGCWRDRDYTSEQTPPENTPIPTPELKLPLDDYDKNEETITPPGDNQPPVSIESPPDLLPQLNQPLQVPLMDQNDPVYGKSGEYMCGPVALSMVLAYYDVNISPTELASTASTQTNTIFSNLLNTAQQFGFTNTAYSNPTWSSALDNAFNDGASAFGTLQSEITSGHPVIVSVGGDTYGSGHYLVVTGVTSDSVYVNNPWGGTKETLGRAKFMEAWKSKGYGYIVPKR